MDAQNLPAAGKVITRGAVRVLWRAPGVWLAVGEDATSARFGEDCFTCTTLTGSLARIRCEGASWRLLLQSECPLDLEATLGPDECAASVFGPFNILIDVIGERGADVYTPRSYAEDFHAALRRTQKML